MSLYISEAATKRFPHVKCPFSEAATKWCSYEKVFCKNAAKLQESTLKCSPVNFMNISRKLFSSEHLWIAAADIFVNN